ncbi:hypothetical protein EJB05_20603, partial [Eragrostis curvula]
MESALIATFMEITNESQAQAVRRLASCQWNLEKALNLFYAGGGVVGTSTAAAPSTTPVEEKKEAEEDEVRAPIPSRVERIYGNSYHGRRSRAARPVPSIWEAPSPKPVPAVPIRGPYLNEVQASGWGEAVPHNAGGNNYEVDQVKEIVEGPGSGEAEPGHGDGNGSDAEEADDVVQEDDNGSVGDYGLGSDEEQDGEDKEDGEQVEVDNTVNYKEDGGEQYSGEYEEKQYNIDEYNNEYGEEEQYNVSDNEGEIDDYGYQMDEDDGYYHDSMMEEEEPSWSDAGERPRLQAAPQSLAEMYRLPYELMYQGSSFHFAKVEAARRDRFLLVNVQSRSDFASSLQNRDLWKNAVISQVVRDNFVFFFLYKGSGKDDEGLKVCNYYGLKEDNQLPAVLVLDPITGERLAVHAGAIQPDDFMMFIDKYMTSNPSERSRPEVVQKTAEVPEASASAAHEQEQEAPETSSASADADDENEQEPVPMDEEAPSEMVESDDEPEEGEKMYKMRVRFPDGSVVAKEFGCKRKVSKLFAFCRSAVHDAGKTEQVAFRIMRLAGRAFEELQNSGATFEDLGLNCATVSVVFIT